MIDYPYLESFGLALRDAFHSRGPFPHLVLNGLFTREAAYKIWQAFPEPGHHFTTRKHLHSDKFTLSDVRQMPSPISEAFAELASPQFRDVLTSITGLNELRDDSALYGGGVHCSGRGGYLDIHADFTRHPDQPTWHRVLNLLVYMNPLWSSDWGGQLELWSPDMRRCVQKIVPAFNRAVLFATSATSFHGHPQPMTCPAHVWRQSLAVYYYSTRETGPALATTDYRPTPSQVGKRLRKWARRIQRRWT